MIDGVKRVYMPTTHLDERGSYNELFNIISLESLGIRSKFIQHCVSMSGRNVLRGLHGDKGTEKIIFCLSGEIQVCFFDNRSSSSTFENTFTDVINEESKYGYYLPAGVANGFLTLSTKSLYYYSQSTLYGQYEQFTIYWDDPRVDCDWIYKTPILSQRDTSHL